ncbi:MAG TPA: aminotransferase class V-fold PLP-dependent enzyme [Candidatus Binataceae bacterium]|nr:aminotransferase class V-fold PLP-dependent enzyme [Candidatus Binataceae bacterium]
MRSATIKAYFNYGGLARPDERVLHRAAAVEREFAPLLYSEDGVRMLEATLGAARQAAASLLGARASGGVSLLPNSSTALNLAISIVGQTLAPGDIAITTDQEHPCVAWPLARLAARGVKVVALGGGSPAEFLDGLGATLRERRPGFAVFSHVSCKDGRVLPVEEAGALLAAREIPYIVDGAQALGQVAVDLARIGAWAYAFTGHKWLCGPMGMGGLWTGERFLRANRLAWSGPLGFARAGGGELESGTLNCALVAGMAEALRLCAAELPQRVAMLAKIRARVAAMLDPLYANADPRWAGPHAPGMLAYDLPPDSNSEELAAAALHRYGVAIKPLRAPYEPNGFRITYSPRTGDAELGLLGDAMRALAAESKLDAPN